MRLVLFALAVRMDENGEAFPAQRTIATDTALGERTVRDALLEARRLSWIAVYDHLRPGQSWRLSHYVACVPDSLDLAALSLGGDVDLERMADQWQAEHGLVEDGMHGSRRPKRTKGATKRQATGAAAGKGAATVAARSTAKAQGLPMASAKGAATDSKKVRRPLPKGAATDSKKVRQPSPTKFPSEVPFEVPKEEGCTLARATDTGGRNEGDGSRRAGAQPLPAPATHNGSNHGINAPEVLQGRTQPEPKPKADLGPSIRRLIESGQTPGDVVKILGTRGCTLADVREAVS